MGAFEPQIALEDETKSSDGEADVPVPQHLKETFRKDGFVVLSSVLSRSTVTALNDRLEAVLRGLYDRGQAPDKSPRLIRLQYKGGLESKTTKPVSSHGVGHLGFRSGNLNNVCVLQMINMHKSDRLFHALAIHPLLGRLVSELAG